jgi:hypothetical protein
MLRWDFTYPDATIAQQIESKQLFYPLVFVLPEESGDEKGRDVFIHGVQHHGRQRRVSGQNSRGAPRGGEGDLVLVEHRDVALVETIEPIEMLRPTSAVEQLGFYTRYRRPEAVAPRGCRGP